MSLLIVVASLSQLKLKAKGMLKTILPRVQGVMRNLLHDTQNLNIKLTSNGRIKWRIFACN